MTMPATYMFHLVAPWGTVDLALRKTKCLEVIEDVVWVTIRTQDASAEDFLTHNILRALDKPPGDPNDKQAMFMVMTMAMALLGTDPTVDLQEQHGLVLSLTEQGDLLLLNSKDADGLEAYRQQVVQAMTQRSRQAQHATH